MSKSNTTLSQTFQLKGTLDISNILSEIKRLRAEAGKTTSVADLLGIDKTIKKLQELETDLTVAMQKGFSTPKSFDDFDKKLNQFYDIANGLGMSFDKISLNSLKSELTTLDTKMKGIKASFKEAFSGVKISNKNDIGNIFTKAVSEGKSLEQAQQEVNKALDEEIARRKEALQLAEKEANKTGIKEKAEKAANDMGNLRAGTSKQKSSFRWSKGAVGQNVGKDITTTSKAKGNNAFEQIQQAYSASIKEASQEAGKTSEQAAKAVELFREKLSALNIEFKNDETVTKNMTESLKNYKNAMKPQENVIKAQKSLQSAENVKSATNTIMNSSNIKNSYKEYQDIQNKASQTSDNLSRGLSNVSNKLQDQVTSSAKKASQSMAQLRENMNKVAAMDTTFDQLISRLKSFTSVTQLFYQFRRVISQTVTDIQNLDEAFVSIATVTDYSLDDLWNSYDKYAEMANELGQTTQSVIESTAQFYQQGDELFRHVLITNIYFLNLSLKS